jgi:GT2 family glycosyltransferase
VSLRRYADRSAVALVDVVIVSFNSRSHLRDCVLPVSQLDDVRVIVVDNASADGSLNAIADLDVTAIARSSNGGFAAGCNDGWRAGSGRHVLFLNPDARIDESSLRRLVASLDGDDAVAAVAPKIEFPTGALAYSLRRFPRLRSTFAQALFLHRLFSRAAWANELIRDPSAYTRAWGPEWVSGACIVVRRSVLEQVGGWDDDFFLYCEDVDLCRRIREAGYEIRYEPTAVVVHAEGASTPRPASLPLLAAARLLYARKHRRPFAAALERVGVGLWAFTHLLVARGGREERRGHARALRIVLSGDRVPRPG